MAIADLGVRISLTDSASVGFGTFAGTLGTFISRIGHANTMLKGLSETQTLAAGSAIGAGILFAGFTSALKFTSSAAQEMQDALVRASLGINATSDQTVQLRTEMINLADYSVFSMSEVADGFTALGERGQTAAAIIGGVGEASVNLAEALNVQLVPAATLLSSAMQQYGADASQATEYSDLLTFAFYNGIPSVSGLQQALDATGGMAHSIGIKFGELISTLDLLGQAGLSGSKAGTSLRYMLSSLADPTSKATKELADLGIVVVNKTAPALLALESGLDKSGAAGAKAVSLFDGTIGSLSKLFAAAQAAGTLHTDETFYQWSIKAGILSSKLYDANGNFVGLNRTIEILSQKINGLDPENKSIALQQLFNVRGGQGATMLLSDLKNITERIDDLTEKQKRTHANLDAAKVTSTLSGTMKELGTTVRSAAGMIGEANLGAFSGITSKVNDAVHAFVSAPDSVHTAAAAFLIFGTVISGLVFVVASIAFIVMMFGTALAPVIGVVAIAMGVILGLAAVVGVLAANWQSIMGFLQPVFSLFQQIGAFLGGVFTKAFHDTNSSMGTMGTIMPIIKSALADMGHSLGELGAALAPTIPFWQMLGKVVLAVVGGVLLVSLGLLFGLFMGLLHGGAALVTGLIHAFSGLVQFITGWVQILVAIFGTLFQVLQALFTGKADQIPKILQHGMDLMGKGVENALTGLSKIVIGIVGGLVGGVLNFFLGFGQGVFAFFNNLTGGIISRVLSGAVGIGKSAMGISTGIMTAIQSLPGDMQKFADNAMQMFINGIVNAIPRLTNAIGGIASTIKGHLGFASPPKEGPLANSHTFMPNMMAMYAQGILANKHLVHGAMQEVSSGMSVAASVTASGVRAAAANAGGGSAGSNGVVPVQIVLDGKVLADCTINRITGELRQVGAGRIQR